MGNLETPFENQMLLNPEYLEKPCNKQGFPKVLHLLSVLLHFLTLICYQKFKPVIQETHSHQSSRQYRETKPPNTVSLDYGREIANCTHINMEPAIKLPGLEVWDYWATEWASHITINRLVRSFFFFLFSRTEVTSALKMSFCSSNKSVLLCQFSCHCMLWIVYGSYDSKDLVDYGSVLCSYYSQKLFEKQPHNVIPFLRHCSSWNSGS